MLGSHHARPVLPAAVLLVLAVGASPLPVLAEVPVDLELVLAVDVSGSVDPDEAKLQRDGYIAALMNPKVQQAIAGGPFGRIAATYVEWAGESHQQVIVGWTELGDRASLSTFASAIGEAPFTTAHWTSISSAIDFSARLFDGNGFEGTRRVIDVSGDGENNRGRPAEWARDEAVARGITINGLPILNDRPNPLGGLAPIDLERYYRANVIGGPGAFLVPAGDFGAFAEAILNKLLLEISNAPPGTDVAQR
ncbi:DUF1194 domain-containing protein [Azospirillum thermophilum]|uniref:VWFA domain-containing protein n=1 Tax=Azospirillum thermophilum TaxID=2202148 RepID=A0A2S2CRI7_9PROT|nr:DUF1194 domain-containing protein [Azospirillum thermophilum]AWK87035.1 hypothetical protein DEW08_13070 [Azospirillum thermophilum]